MTLQELAVLKQEHNLPVKIAIINNGFLGMVRQWQQFFYEKRYAGTPMLSPDYMKLAEAYGIASLRVTKNDEVFPAIQRANAHDGPFLVEFQPMETGDMVFMSHEGEEFHFVLEGKLEFRTDDRVEVLFAGDSLYFESEMNHSFRSLEPKPARAIVVVWNRRD